MRDRVLGEEYDKLVVFLRRSNLSTRVEQTVLKHHTTLHDVFHMERGSPNVIEAKREIAAILKHECKLSYPQVGALLNRDHTSIMTLLKTDGEKTEKRAKRRLDTQLSDAARAVLKELPKCSVKGCLAIGVYEDVRDTGMRCGVHRHQGDHMTALGAAVMRIISLLKDK